MSRSSRFVAVAIGAIVSMILIAGCGSKPVLELLTISPRTAQSTVGGQDVQFSATGTYSDGGTSTTMPVTWAVSDTNTVLITSTGLARCLANTGVGVTITVSAPGKGGTLSDSAVLTCQ
ncbi:MAG TPA: Ig-like domain-containing protein [Terriglobales bacterium]|nr:Ig-like domain-containing protein [Terriglobales bacterium]